jgi:lipopolysaccharide/colanic/teichoic acid biosynthesis glycosyltransferase
LPCSSIFDPCAYSSGNGLYAQPSFDRLLYLERKRAERSRRPFLLLRLDLENLQIGKEDHGLAKELGDALSSCTRETDIRGWLEQGKVVGIIFTEMGIVDEIVKGKIFLKIRDKLCDALGPQAVSKIKVSYHIFPGISNGTGKDLEWFDSSLYPELSNRNHSRRPSLFLKRTADFLGSLAGLVILSPVFLAVALAIKFTSRGPVFFKQERVGQGGKKFTFLKFRSMYHNCDERAHKEYIATFISQGKEEPAKPENNGGTGVYKLRGDCRITPVGRFLRKTSLDELPQFINVLMGDMSLVGRGPPPPPEWGLEVKPGITGLWQVEARSKSAFNDMVRLDLKYIKNWSLWLDLKIMLKTPWVVITGNGGY